jgi:thioredoxin 1
LEKPLEKVDDAIFGKQVLKSLLPVLVDLWDPEAPGLNNNLKALRSIAKEYKSALKVMRVSTAEGSATMQAFRVRGAPTLMLFQDGGWIASSLGQVNSVDAVREFVRQHISVEKGPGGSRGLPRGSHPIGPC